MRELILNRDPRGFLTWDIVAETMFPVFGVFIPGELRLLRANGWRGFWRQALHEPRLGLPFPSPAYPFSSTNTIHHACHLCRFQLDTASRIWDYSLIFEFGGGYGSLCRVCHAIGFTGTYIIFDFPELSALQRYYLWSAGLKDVATISDLNALAEAVTAAPRGLRLFIAAWSLSESLLPLRKAIGNIVSSFDAFLIGYQEGFSGIDNRAFFSDWQNLFPEVSWKESKIAHLPGNRYLFGIKQKP